MNTNIPHRSSASTHESPAVNTLTWEHTPIVDICAVQAGYGHLLVLTTDGSLHGVDLDTGCRTTPCSVPLPPLPPPTGHTAFGTPAYRLHASPDGRYAAIVTDYGRHGLVVDVATGSPTMQLDGGDYYPHTVPFSACFLRHRDRTIFVHRTAWNRLDAADPATGASLTARDIAPYANDERPEHYLDYFHGRLVPSLDGSRLFDDGWVWQPVSIPRAWSVDAWLDANPFESEDGESVVSLTQRDDWDTPACWIDSRHIAYWGLADWDEEEFAETGQDAGVRILDVTEALQSNDRRIPMATEPDRIGDLFSDGASLYVATHAGTTIWNIASGTPLGTLPGFVARRHDPVRGSLIAFDAGTIAEYRLPVPAAHTA
ncbi:hypothetical protein BLA6860_03197 [Burkholderia lata]|uniref:hypothetical protein n=1 Tax=Burkholderia lata (strain ATCC 17760 / DSM 23089 / LMG 22485 / NCIMB 9086 / R18194 / 383) TaxID=482957 RepID=UPI001452E1AF|nr:hypothetical protein [Burkholderia lata]VWB68362.1 hypothetical protein BLA6860_03197 [Burkholderia lata]